jgi:HK97 family phage prohead protease
MFYSVKSIDAEVKDIDTVKGIVTGYFANFGNVDSDKDMILPGAFKKTLQENGPGSIKQRILHLYQHDATRPVSKPSVLKEDLKGLYFESTIAKTRDGLDLLEMYEKGIIDEHSIGYRVVKEQKKENHNELIELKLWEGSSVTWGANPETPFMGMKSLTPQQAFSKLDLYIKAIRSNNLSEDGAIQLELMFNQIKNYIFSLLPPTEPVKTTPTEPKPDELRLINIFRAELQL